MVVKVCSPRVTLSDMLNPTHLVSWGDKPHLVHLNLKLPVGLVNRPNLCLHSWRRGRKRRVAWQGWGRAGSPEGPFFLALLHRCGALVNLLLLKFRPWRRKGLLCEQEARRRWSRGKRRGEESDLGVPWEWTSWLLCFLIPLSSEQQGGREKRRSKRGRRMMRVKESCFHTKGRQAGGLKELLCVHLYTSTVLYLLPAWGLRWMMPGVKLVINTARNRA